MSDASESEEINRRKRGRPKGHRLSTATKLKISASRSEQERHKREVRRKKPLPSTSPLPIDTAYAVMTRDTSKDGHPRCCGCHEKGPDLMIYSFIDEDTVDLLGARRDTANYAVLCSFCRDFAEVSHAHNIEELLGAF
jgi:hypothetical protein